MINEKYLIKKKLGKGRSAVYLCEDTDFAYRPAGFPGKDIAIKILSPGTDAAETKIFQDEFFTLLKLNHPNIVKSFDDGTILETGQDEKEILTGSRFFTLEYVDGVELLKFPGLKSEAVLKEIIKQVASVLYYLHLSNYIYYDLKPENILVSNPGGKPLVKLIDLGFAQNIVENKETVIRGTAEYIAPEILNNAKHDYRVDFYSLGIILYRIIYGKFPFDTSDELTIYKSQIEKEFDFPGAEFSVDLISLVKKLLAKDPSERYGNAVQILEHLGIPVDESVYKDWIPANVFADRKDYLNIIKSYITDETSNEVFSIRGSEGAGKTSLAFEIYSGRSNAVFVSNKNSLTGIDFIKYTLKKIIFNEAVYSRLTAALHALVGRVLQSEGGDFLNDLKSIFNNLPEDCRFILILDAFNSYDSYSLEVFKNLIPIFQVNKLKIILTENSDRHFLTDFIFNLREINLTPFTEVHLNEFVEKSFSSLFPGEELKRLILSYADLLPGSLEAFIKDIILLKVLTFSGSGVSIAAGENTDALLRSSHEEIYNLRISKLGREELDTARFISAFDVFIDAGLISRYFNFPADKMYEIFSGLQQKNIIHPVQTNTNPVFTSEGLKHYVYSSVEDKPAFHSSISLFLAAHYPGLSNIELARHYRLSGNYRAGYEALKKELDQAEKISAYSYELNILKELTGFKLSADEITEIKIRLCDVYFKLSQYKPALDLIEGLLRQDLADVKKTELLILRGKCLIGLTEYRQGKDELQNMLSSVGSRVIKNQLLLEIASVEFNLNHYDEASNICRQILDGGSASPEERGLTYQMLGLISFYRDGDPDSSLKYFEEGFNAYAEGDLRFRMAQMQMNIGNIYGVKGEHARSREYWEKSLEINRSIGNIEQEASLLGNFGIYYYDMLDFDKSIESYQKALSIFTSLGNKKSFGLVQINLGENYILTCDYQKAIEMLNSAVSIFKQLQNIEEAMEAEIMLGKLCFALGDFERLNSIVKDLEAESGSENFSEKYMNYFVYLTLLSKFKNINVVNDGESLEKLKKYFLLQENKFDSFSCAMVIVHLLIRADNLEKAYRELTDEEFINLCSENILFEAERQFMIGTIVEKMPRLEIKAHIEYYNTAYEIISETYITELTWKVLFALAKSYSERGNANKAKEYIKYSKAIINYIADNIKDSRTRNIYLEEPERKQALEKLNDI